MPERILIASECIGDAMFCLEKAVEYANSRIVFNRPIGQNQGVQFPLASAYSKIQAAEPYALQSGQSVRRGQTLRE